jgi:hypothetical protein
VQCRVPHDSTRINHRSTGHGYDIE